MLNCVLLDRPKNAKTRKFYNRRTIELGWSRNVLVHQLETEFHKRMGESSD